ncbi:MAG TPA: MMPL family transporter [Solirubrobacteraceae bacterium]|nr:MMPL family transporter [Solirubrobacteraceae bacterium]
MRAAARWCYTHRLLVVALWVVALVGATIASRGVGSNYQDNFSLPQTQSFQAMSLLERAAPKVSGDVDRLVVATDHGRVTDPAVKARTEQLLAKIARLPHVTEIGSPYGSSASAQISPSGQVAFANITFDVSASTLSGREESGYDKMIQASSGKGVTFAGDGQVAEEGDPSSPSTGLPLGFIAAGIVLLIVFGTLPAMLLPLLTAGFALGTGIAVVGLLSNVIGMASFSSELAMLIGLGVGVDYALFIVTRYRQGMLRGLDREEAAVQALDTSGRAVMFAGAIVCLAMIGMVLLGVSFLYGVAIAAAIIVAFTVISALTLTPALLCLFGARVLRRSDRRAIAAADFACSDESPSWRRWTDWLARRPALFAACAAAVMLLLAVPFFSMRLGAADASSDPTSTTTHQAYDLLAKGFGPGYNGPLQLVATVHTASERVAFTAVTDAVAHTADVRSVAGPTFTPGRDGHPGAAVAEVYPDGSPQAASTTALLNELRGTVIPLASAHTGIDVLVGGQTAIFADFASVLTAKLPLFVGIVVLVSSLLLMVVFRSLVVPVAAALMNLLSTAASLGVVTAVFQFGWFGKLLGITPGPIEAFVPVLMFPILFGLSMDYEVFLVSRIYEEWHHRENNGEAVTHGLAATGKTITAAAAIMVLVFAAFVLGGQRIIEMFGIGLASAVLLDGVIVRSVLVPALMLMLGKANWHMPAWLERRLPHLRVEGRSVRVPVPVPPVRSVTDPTLP